MPYILPTAVDISVKPLLNFISISKIIDIPDNKDKSILTVAKAPIVTSVG